MSWAAHNPEAYTDICIVGVTRRLLKAVKDNGFDLRENEREAVHVAVMALAEEDSNIFSDLVVWANREVAEAQSGFQASAP